MKNKFPLSLLFTGLVLCLPLTVSAYFNSLTNPVSFSSDFTSYSSGGGAFDIDPAFGLQLKSVAPDAVDGIQAYNTTLSASQNWSVTVKAHLSAFTNNQLNPFYRAGLLFAKLGVDFPTTAQNVVNLQLERGSEAGFGESMSNSITSTLSTNGVESPSTVAPFGQAEDVFLRLAYLSDGATVDRSYSVDGITYTSLGSVNLGDTWGLTAEDELVLALVGTALAYDGESMTTSVSPGEIYLRDVSVVPEPTTCSLLVLGAVAAIWFRKRQNRS
jgi:hypothetical protein